MKSQIVPIVFIFVILHFGNSTRIKRGGWGNEPSSQNWNVVGVGVAEEPEPGLPEPVRVYSRAYPYSTYNAYYSEQSLPGQNSAWASRTYLPNYYYY